MPWIPRKQLPSQILRRNSESLRQEYQVAPPFHFVVYLPQEGCDTFNKIPTTGGRLQIRTMLRAGNKIGRKRHGILDTV